MMRQSDHDGLKAVVVVTFVFALCISGIMLYDLEDTDAITSISTDVSDTMGRMLNKANGIYDQTQREDKTIPLNSVVVPGGANSNYWVEISTVSLASAENIRIGDMTYDSSTRSIGVGNNNKLTIAVWTIQDSKLYRCTLPHRECADRWQFRSDHRGWNTGG